LSGLDYASYIETRILKPIGMNDSFVADGENHDTMARGHRPWFGTKRPMEDSKTHRVYAPAGGVIASANDVARYLSIMMNGEDDVISATSKAAMLRPASDASPFYGFGWLIDAQKGTVYHSGESPGTETLAVLTPAKKKAVIVLVNAGGGIECKPPAGRDFILGPTHSFAQLAEAIDTAFARWDRAHVHGFARRRPGRRPPRRRVRRRRGLARPRES
jgi:CubicO group peptidase (beta-lactamase class C family)